MKTAERPASNTGQALRKIEELETIVRTRPGGATLLAELGPHAEEVNFLVQRNRRVAVVWQRNSGPEFARALVDSGFDELLTIPRSIGGATLEGLLLAMADVLQRHGSLQLRHVIAANAHDLLRCARACTTLREVIDSLAALRLARVEAADENRDDHHA
jgi:hypothetical protein